MEFFGGPQDGLILNIIKPLALKYYFPAEGVRQLRETLEILRSEEDIDCLLANGEDGLSTFPLALWLFALGVLPPTDGEEVPSREALDKHLSNLIQQTKAYSTAVYYRGWCRQLFRSDLEFFFSWRFTAEETGCPRIGPPNGPEKIYYQWHGYSNVRTEAKCKKKARKKPSTKKKSKPE